MCVAGSIDPSTSGAPSPWLLTPTDRDAPPQEDDGQHATRVAAEHEKRSRAAIYIQRLWRGRTPHLCLKIRVAVGALPRRDRCVSTASYADADSPLPQMLMPPSFAANADASLLCRKR
jgi:hypothetical protein